MKSDFMAGALALSLSLGACGEAEAPRPENFATPATPADGQVYSGTGEVSEVSGDQVTISHGPIEGIGWPAMTMAFQAGSPDMVRGIDVGDRVRFGFRDAGGRYVLTSLDKLQ